MSRSVCSECRCEVATPHMKDCPLRQDGDAVVRLSQCIQVDRKNAERGIPLTPEMGGVVKVQIHGTEMVIGQRYSGPPSKLLPMLRDLGQHQADERILVEFDTAKERKEAVVTGYRRGQESEQLQLQDNLGRAEVSNRYTRRGSAALKNILAFRILRIVPADLDPEDPQALVTC